jgi:hypothetical protein
MPASPWAEFEAEFGKACLERDSGKHHHEPKGMAIRGQFGPFAGSRARKAAGDRAAMHTE